MATRMVNIDRQTPMLLPPSLQQWVLEDDPVHFVIEVVESMDLREAAVNWRGSGSAQYPPAMMLALLIYNYATGRFSSREIERATYTDVAVRYLSADTHPDHDTIATFRRENERLIEKGFVRVLEVARAMGLGRLGDVSIDGTKLLANAARRQVVSQEEVEQRLPALEAQVEKLLVKAQEAEGRAADPGGVLPEKLRHAKKRREAMERAKALLAEQSARQHAQREKERAAFDGEGPGEAPRQRPAEPQAKDNVNLSDPEAALLPQKKGGCAPSYNVQVAVCADPQNPLIVAAEVSADSNDRRQLTPVCEAVVANGASLEKVHVDSGYDNSAQIYEVERRYGCIVYCPPQEQSAERPAKGKEGKAAGGQPRRRHAAEQRTYDFREGMRAALRSGHGQKSQRLRATTAEPVFSRIKNQLGFQRFRLRGLAKVAVEWTLICLAFNCVLLSRYRAAERRLKTSHSGALGGLMPELADEGRLVGSLRALFRRCSQILAKIFRRRNFVLTLAR